MTDTRNPDAVDSPPDDAPDANPDSPPVERDDARSDIEQAVAARSDAVARGDGDRGDEPAPFADPGMGDGVGGTGGDVKNQDDDAQ